jgi:hypothetical protein
VAWDARKKGFETVITNLISKKAMLTGICVAAFALAAQAVAGSSRIRVEVPFAFTAGNDTIPAGTYFVNIDDTLRQVLFFSTRSTETHIARLSPSLASRKVSDSEIGTLRFAKYGDHYVLKTVFRPGQTAGNQLPSSARERELSQQYGGPEVATVRTLQ